LIAFGTLASPTRVSGNCIPYFWYQFQRAERRQTHGINVFGPERTIEQDSTFAFRVIVDIAIRALSKAINDPTTVVLAIDQLQRLLRVHHQQIMDGAGRPALRVELDLLDRAIETLCPLPDDLAVARVPDMQGLGRSSGGLPA
jgi:hypothetical protein